MRRPAAGSTATAQLPRARCRACAAASSVCGPARLPPRLPARAVASEIHAAAAVARQQWGLESSTSSSSSSSSSAPETSAFLTAGQHPRQHQRNNPPQQQHQQQQHHHHHHLAAATAALATSTAAIAPGAASAAEGLPPSLLDAFTAFLEQVHALGPWGAVLFVATVALAEMVPLFPTQPLSLASGLLFGAKQGALLMLLGVTLAGLGAFTVARGVGRPLAERIIRAETGHGGGKNGGKDGSSGDSSSSSFGSAWASVEAAVESGGFMRQLTAITLLRLTPVIPYSATNYLLGLTPVQPGAFVLGTLAGMSVWATLYAGLGGASRALLDNGADLELLLADLGDKAGQYSADVAAIGLAVAGVGVAAWLWRSSSSGGGGGGGGGGGPGLPLVDPQQQRPQPRVAERSAATSSAEVSEREGEGVLTRQ